MSQDTDVIGRVREELLDCADVVEKKMFGGTAFMVNGKMCVCVSGKDDSIMVRVGPGAYEKALTEEGATPTIMKGRAIKGYIDINDPTSVELGHWIDLALDFNKELTG